VQSGYTVRGEVRFAAIFEQSNGVVARFGMSAQTYQPEFDRYAGEGYKLKLIDGY
jgi:hypothetical protein